MNKDIDNNNNKLLEESKKQINKNIKNMEKYQMMRQKKISDEWDLSNNEIKNNIILNTNSDYCEKKIKNIKKYEYDKIHINEFLSI